MAQISKGDTFVDGQQVTGARLNQLVDSSVLLVGAITDQPALTAATLASDDLVIISDTSASALKKATVNDILGSSLPITASSVTATSVVTSVVNAEANSDILITPNDGANVTGKTFSSGDGITATVASTAHGLVTGQNVTITASNSAYSGTYKITVTTVDAFTYVVVPTTTAASGTCSYVREGSVRVAGELNTSGGLNVAGNAVITGATAITGAFTSSGTANFTGALQVNGAVGYVLTEIVEETMTSTTPAVGNTAGVFTSSAFTKPTDEIWVFEADYHVYGVSGWGFTVGFRYNSVTAYSGTYQYTRLWTVSGNTSPEYFHEITRWVAGTGTTFTAETVKCDTRIGSSANVTIFPTSISVVGWVGFSTINTTPSKFRIYKYKTA